MIRMSLAEAARVLHTQGGAGDREFRGVATDSRTLEPGNLFVALEGMRFDGHGFVDEAAARGASAALVSRTVTSRLPLLRVSDTRSALGWLAGEWRSRFDLLVLAVTGSNGKTTVKEMLSSILRQVGSVLATTGNLNNDIGVPLTLLRLEREHRYAVVEMGANHPGEIAALTELTRPAVAVVTNAAPAHLEGFGDIEGVARAKGEIFSGLSADGTCIINADDPYADLWKRLAAGRQVLTFGLAMAADVTAVLGATPRGGTASDSAFRLVTPMGSVDLVLSLRGQHNIRNALAAAAAAAALAVPIGAIKRGLEAVTAVRGRLQPLPGIDGGLVVDDTYNANPGSLASALEALSTRPGEKVLVLGDMAELGEHGMRWHEAAGRMVRERGFTRLLAIGELSRFAVQAFGAGGEHFDDHQALVAALQTTLLHPDAVVLVKGSRRMQMERVVQALVRAEEPQMRVVGHG